MFKYVTPHKKKVQNKSFVYRNHVIIIQGENGYTRKEGQGKEDSETYGMECGKRGMNREGENYYFYMKPTLHKKN